MPGPSFPINPSTPDPLTRRARRWRSLFLSDLHLGTSRGRPDAVVDFLSHAAADHLFLVGDIFDGWAPRGRKGPLPDHRQLLKQLDRLASDGTTITYVPGNHDSGFRNLSGQNVGPMQVAEETRHTLADGRVMLVTHGDMADPLMAMGDHLAWLGGKADIALRRAGRLVARLVSGQPCHGATWLDRQLVALNAALHPRSTFAGRLTTRARHLGFDGVICGHYHIPALADLAGITYANCGDWLDHFSAVTETAEGRLGLVAWPRPVAAGQMEPASSGALPVPLA